MSLKRAADVLPAVLAGETCRASLSSSSKFAVGDHVRCSGAVVAHHNRLPAYARNRVGVVVRHHGGFVFPDTRAHGRGDNPQHVYGVRFSAQELWGLQNRRNDAVYLDLWESYIDLA